MLLRFLLNVWYRALRNPHANVMVLHVLHVFFMCFCIIVLSRHGFVVDSGGRVKEKIKYTSPSFPLSPEFIDTLHHIVLCHQTKKQFETMCVVNN